MMGIGFIYPMLLMSVLHRDSQEKWIYLKNEFETIQFLMENNIPLSVSKKLLRICCINTVERLKNNPYALVSFCDIIPNIWSLVEDIATNLGFNIEDERRLIGMIEINLYTRLNRGHTARSQEAKKPRSQEAKKPRSQEAKKPRSQEAKKPRSQEAKKPRSQEAKKPRSSK
ncbi:helix-hairpin-helix domain-containing protein [Photobacterium damselae subsp. piscicida]|nr:helix-hairpin-helix domain-containing protein [Photobacterium damselae subsp. piscicida]MDP2556298.1 helix-hairpin-helix domain-containing protein [Photobacterium damselae subsp. piscicida]